MAFLDTIEELMVNNYRQQDIAVLCRGNKNASQVAAMLLAHGKQVVSADSLVLSFSPEVNFLVAWMYYLNDTADKVSMTQILYYLHHIVIIVGEMIFGHVGCDWIGDRQTSPHHKVIACRLG